MTGILTARLLQEKGLEAVVLEEKQIGAGTTGKTTAKITVQHGPVYSRLIRQFGRETAARYLHANQAALERYREMAEGIDCDMEECGAWLYSVDSADVLEQEHRAALDLGVEARLQDDTELPFPVAAALRFPRQLRFHPLRFLQGAARPLRVYEGTKALRVEEKRIETPGGTVTADHIVFACHFPFVNAPGYYFARMHQERSYVLALEGTPPMRDMYLGVDTGALSFRPAGEALLLGGGGHRTGENTQGGRYDELRRQARAFWPGCRERAHWSAQDCMPMDGIPYIGRFSPGAPSWYVATGFQKWGMTSAMAAAMSLTDLICGGSGAQVFSPERFTPAASARNFAKDTGQAVKGLARKVLEGPRAEVDALPPGHGGIVDVGGEKMGVYKDEQGRVYAVSPRCPHLGCQVEWNPDEKSWDCPCHGSRFDKFGRRLDGPAQDDLDGQSGADE